MFCCHGRSALLGGSVQLSEGKKREFKIRLFKSFGFKKKKKGSG